MAFMPAAAVVIGPAPSHLCLNLRLQCSAQARNAKQLLLYFTMAVGTHPSWRPVLRYTAACSVQWGHVLGRVQIGTIAAAIVCKQAWLNFEPTSLLVAAEYCGSSAAAA